MKQAVTVDAVTDPGAVHLSLNQPGLLEDLQVLGNSRLGERQFVDDLATDTGRTSQ
jgi:hypothetical protein